MSEDKVNELPCKATCTKEACDKIDPPGVVEERSMRHWVIRWMVKFISFITSVVVLSMMYGYVFQSRDIEKEITGGIIDNVFTVLKFMFQQ